MKKIFVLTISLLCFSVTGFASSWYYVGISALRQPTYIDNDTVKKNDQSAIIWLKMVNDNGTYVLDQFGFDRKNKTDALLHETTYTDDGVILRSISLNTPRYVPIQPNSQEETIYNLIW